MSSDESPGDVVAVSKGPFVPDTHFHSLSPFPSLPFHSLILELLEYVLFLPNLLLTGQTNPCPWTESLERPGSSAPDPSAACRRGTG